MENLVIDETFWQGKKVLITGHTGFKGSWLSLWLLKLGANVVGYALKPFGKPNLFEEISLANQMVSVIGDVRDPENLKSVISSEAPEIIFHMAAQSLVRYSYKEPLETFSTNIMGTVNLFEAVRLCGKTRAVVNITSDKCYDNREQEAGYKEDAPMGGFDPYSSSKGCAELVTSAYRNSFFNINDYASHGVAVASVRAGNVIGGGDWSEDRLIPDFIRALAKGEPLIIRNPNAIRPWQHVLEPLSGYLMLAEKLYDGATFAEPWNFGPHKNDARPVQWIVERMCEQWGDAASYEVDKGTRSDPHEAKLLMLDSSKARDRLNWHPRWDIEQALEKIVDWTRLWMKGSKMKDVCLDQIKEYMSEERAGS